MTNEERIEAYLDKEGHYGKGGIRYSALLDAIADGFLTFAEEPSSLFSLDWPHGWETEDGREATILTQEFMVEGVPHVVWLLRKEGRNDLIRFTYQDGTLFPGDDPVVRNKPAPKREVKGFISKAHACNPTAITFCPGFSSLLDVLPATLIIHEGV